MPLSPYSSFKSSVVSKSKSTKSTQLHSLHISKTQKLNKLDVKYQKLEKKIEKLKSQIVANKPADMTNFTSVDYFYQMCDIHLPPNLSMVIKEFVKMGKRKPNGIRYSNQMKHLAFTVYFYGPRVYNFFKTLLQLPNPRTLRRFIHKMEIVPGLNDLIFESIKFKISNLKDDAKDCVLCIKKMAIKTHLFYNLSKDYILGFNNSCNTNTYEPAKYVLCFMLRSLNYDWKQHIAYFYINNNFTEIHLKNTVFAVISHIQSISLNIRVMTVNQSSIFTSFLNLIYVSYERPYFYVYGQKIFCVFDVSYLLKSTRNNFFKYNLTFLNNTVDKIYLDDFYKLDQNVNKFAPKLTDMHINPGPLQKTEVKYATQIFSASVAIGMQHYIEVGMLPVAAKTTMQFIEYMDKLFDLLNSKKVGHKDFNRPFQNTARQRKHLLQMLEIFKNMRVLTTEMDNGKIITVDITNQTQFLNCWKITISSLLMLWDDVFTKSYYVLCTYRFNHDCFENLFRQFRNINGHYINPTPITFLRTFKKIFFQNMFKHFDGHKSNEDLGKILTTITNTSSLSNNSCVLFSEKLPSRYHNLKVYTTDYRELCFPENNSLSYICGYLLKKCVKKHSCSICLNYASNQNKIDKSFLSSYFKVHQNVDNLNCENLNISPNQFFNYINLLDNIFVINFPKLSVENNIGKNLKNLIDVVPFTHPCHNFDIESLKTLYIRLKIFHAIKNLNKNMLLLNRKKPKNRYSYPSLNYVGQ